MVSISAISGMTFEAEPSFIFVVVPSLLASEVALGELFVDRVPWDIVGACSRSFGWTVLPSSGSCCSLESIQSLWYGIEVNIA